MLGKASLPLKVNSSPKDLWTEIILKETALLHDSNVHFTEIEIDFKVPNTSFYTQNHNMEV